MLVGGSSVHKIAGRGFSLWISSYARGCYLHTGVKHDIDQKLIKSYACRNLLAKRRTMICNRKSVKATRATPSYAELRVAVTGYYATLRMYVIRSSVAVEADND